MKRIVAVFCSVILVLALCASALAEETSSPSQWNGSYVYEADEKYSITILDHSLRFGFGSNYVSVTCEDDTDGGMRAKSNGQFHSIDVTMVLQEDTLRVSGDILLKNARGAVDESSLQGLENAAFIREAPFEISNIGGTQWNILYIQETKDEEGAVRNFLSIVFQEDGTGSIGDWFSGADAFTYVIEGETVRLSFADKNLEAIGKIEDNLLILDLGNVLVTYQR